MKLHASIISLIAASLAFYACSPAGESGSKAKTNQAPVVTMATAVSLMTYTPCDTTIAPPMRFFDGSVLYSVASTAPRILLQGVSMADGGHYVAIECDERTNAMRTVPHEPSDTAGFVSRWVQMMKGSDGSLLMVFCNEQGKAVDVFHRTDVSLEDNVKEEYARMVLGRYSAGAADRAVDFSFSTYEAVMGREDQGISSPYKFYKNWTWLEPVMVCQDRNFIFIPAPYGLDLIECTISDKDGGPARFGLKNRVGAIYRKDFGKGVWPWTSNYVMSQGVVNMYPRLTVKCMRNEILARRGYNFRVDSLAAFYNARDWYKPIANNKNIIFSDVERLNLEVIEASLALSDDERFSLDLRTNAMLGLYDADKRLNK